MSERKTSVASRKASLVEQFEAQVAEQRRTLTGEASSRTSVFGPTNEVSSSSAASPPRTLMGMGNTMGSTRKIVKQGWILKQGGASGSLFSRESWKRRWVVLEEKRLLWHEGEGALPKGEVRVLGAQIDPSPPEVAKRPHAFAIRHPDSRGG